MPRPARPPPETAPRMLYRLLAEQLSHTLDLLRAQIETLEARIQHDEEITGLRLAAIERGQADQEARLRLVTDSVVRLTTATNLAQIGQAAFALILSALAAYLGRR